MKHINYKLGNIELRTTGKYLMQTFENDMKTCEIVQWEGNFCFTLAYWVEDSEGFYLRFVGEGPLDENVDILDFMHLAKEGYRILGKL